MSARALVSRTRVVVASVAALALTATLVPSMAFAAPLDPVVVDGMNLDHGGVAVINDLERTEVAPGLVHVKYERLEAAGWQQINILRAELSDQTVRVGYLTPETVSGPGATVTEMVDGAGAIAGINLDRFDINNSWAAAGWGVQDGQVIKSGNPDAARSIVIDDEGLGHIAELLLVGTAEFGGGGSVPITGINVYSMGSGVAMFTEQWGPFARNRAFSGAQAVEVLVGADNTVLSVSETSGEGTLAPGVRALLADARSAEAEVLRALQVGESVTIGYSIDAGALSVREAGGAWHPILQNGEVVDTGNAELHPRTMVGFSEDGASAYFVQIDGRTAIARGMTLAEQGQFMKELGAYNATNADGGGSSQMNVRQAGDELTTIANSPSDGYERRDGDGLGLFLSRPGSGQLTGFRLEALLDADHDEIRVFPGLSRTVAAVGHDEARSAVAAAPAAWESGDGAVASVSGAGRVTGVSSGHTTLTARNGGASGTGPVHVLGGLERLTSDQTTINLEAQGSSAIITLTGHDAQGFSAPIEASDVTVENPNPEVFSVTPTEDGRFLVSAVGETGSATLGFEAGGSRTEIAVAVPLELRLIDDFSDISGWSTAHDRAPTGGIEPGDGHEGSPSIRLNYNFTESTGTRGRYAVAPGAPGNGTTGGIDIPGRPQKLSVWIKGDGKGSLIRLQVMQANGVRNWIDGPGGSQSLKVTWTGWQRVDFIVPESFEFPLKLERIRALETVAAKQYTGSLEFSKIYAYLPPEGVVAPVNERAEDPIVAEAGATDDDDLRIAVMSDAQFVAREPDAYQVTGARKALQEIVASDPDALIINGDLVDEAAIADFELATSVLEDELAGVDFPWWYVPGNHEIMGGPLSNFVSMFGDTRRTVDLDGTRIIMLDSSSGILRNDFGQVQMLRSQLDAARTDDSITGVLVVSHMPTNDPLPTKGSQLSDRNEAQMIDDWVQEFRASSGKSIAYIAGHVGVFHTSSVDGVPYVINGNSGKGPASSVADGGFTGWTMLGIDPEDGEWASADEQWLEVETKPRVDEDAVAVTAPSAMLIGESAEVSAQFEQDRDHDARTVPVQWPVSSRWAGTGVFVGEPSLAPSDAIVAVDALTSTITALRPGTAAVEVTVNGRTGSAPVQVTALEFEPGELTVTGAPRVGQTLTASYDGELPDGAVLTYEWLRDGEVIPDAAADTYVLTAEDLGGQVSARVTLSHPSYASATVTGSSVEVGTGELAVVAAPSVSGTPAVGATLSATAGQWDRAVSTSTQWLRDGAVIPGATGSEYVLVAADGGARLSVRVTASAPGYGSATAESATVVVSGKPQIAQPAPVPGGDELTGGNRGGVSATVDGTRVTLSFPAGSVSEAQWLSVYGFSTPSALGWNAVTSGAVTVDASVLGGGSHKIAAYTVDGTLIGWAPVELGSTTATGVLPALGGSVPLLAVGIGSVLMLAGLALWFLRRRGDGVDRA